MQPAPQLPAVEYAERSDPGRDPDKQVNEDACGRRETRFGHLCVVCDGMGGHAAGREAAELALATVFEVFDNAPDGTPPGPLLKGAFEEASRRIHVMPTSEVSLGRPGSTGVAVLMHAQGTEVVHIGDSRAYLVHEGQIFRLTRDHSVVQEFVDRGLLTPAQAAHHPDSNRITRALGMAGDVEAELRPQPVHHVTGDTFVLCSDGLCDLLEDHEILAVVAAEPPAQAVGKLVDLANARGGHDNITVLVLRARETVVATAFALAPTVVQTSVGEPAATVPAAPPPITVPDPRSPAHVAGGAVPPWEPARGPYGTEPGLAPAPIQRPPEIPPAPASTRARPRSGPSPAAVILGVVLGLAAFALLGAVLFAHMQDRGGKRNASPVLPQTPALDAAGGTAGPTATASVPSSAPTESAAPLPPSPSARPRR